MSLKTFRKELGLGYMMVVMGVLGDVSGLLLASYSLGHVSHSSGTVP